MQSRRTFVGMGAGAVLAGLAGCLEGIPFVGDEPLEFSANRATVPDAVLDNTGYDEQSVEEAVIEETVEVAGQSQEVHVTNWQAMYDKSVDLGELGLPVEGEQRAAVCSLLSSPQMSVLDRPFNPIGEMSAEELAGTVQDRYEGMSDFEHLRDASRPLGGQSTTVGEFATEADLTGEGTTVELRVHIAEAVELGDDLVFGVGAYPAELADQEADELFAMFSGVVHENE